MTMRPVLVSYFDLGVSFGLRSIIGKDELADANIETIRRNR